MILRIIGPNTTQEKYTYPGKNITVIVGRKPKTDGSEEILAVEQPTASRVHLLIKLAKGKTYVKDLGSSNGTKVNDQSIQPQELIEICRKDKVRLGQSQTYISVQLREREREESNGDQSDSSEEVERSREKKKITNSTIEAQFKISESTMKMLKQMTADKKSKQERIKFLKLMGSKNVEEGWQKIQEYLKKQILFGSSSKKTSEELERQFTLGRSTSEKKGLGKR